MFDKSTHFKQVCSSTIIFLFFKQQGPKKSYNSLIKGSNQAM